MKDLRLSLIQADLAWRDPAGNRARLGEALAPLAGASDLVLLPEMFTSAFSIEATAGAEAHPGATLDWMRDQAARLDAALCGSVAVSEAGQRFNRLLFVTPEGTCFNYDKRHLFRMMDEHTRYAAGQRKLLLNWRGWRILPLVCYDLRFPVWSRYTRAEPYDLLLYVANWPAARTRHWSTLLCARAIENLSYVAGVNRVGVDGNGIAYEGHSAVFDPRGATLLDLGTRAHSGSALLSASELADYRARFPAHLDADEFMLSGAVAGETEAPRQTESKG